MFYTSLSQNQSLAVVGPALWNSCTPECDAIGDIHLRLFVV